MTLPPTASPPATVLDVAAPRPCLRRATLVIILFIAAGLRFAALGDVPPGLHQDEAVNAWNAWCLLHTGRDQFGTPWPICYYRAIGDYRSASYLYALLPFQAVGGMNVFTTRLPAAVAGVLAVAVTYWLGRRWFGATAGLLAAGVLALDPTQVQLSRWAVEAALVPLAVALSLAALTWAGLVRTEAPQRLTTQRALLAGAVVGVWLYGYPALRLYLPALLLVTVLAGGRLRALLQAPGAQRAALAFIGMLALVSAPLAYEHVANAERIGKRGAMTWVWQPDDPPPERAAKVVARYAAHFSPAFLYQSGDVSDVVTDSGFGFQPWYVLPWQLLGAVLLLRRALRSAVARVLLAAVLLFPIADSFNTHVSLHALRCATGLVPLALLTAVGIAWPLQFLQQRRAQAAAVTLVVAVMVSAAEYATRFAGRIFAERPASARVHDVMQADILAAARWLRPRQAAFDAVIWTTADTNQPYLNVLVGLDYRPGDWFDGPRSIEATGSWDRCRQFGRHYFLNDGERRALLAELARTPAAERVALVLRPDETPHGEPMHTAAGPDGRATLIISAASH